MLDRIRFRLNDILDAVDQIDLLLADKSFADVIRERPTRAAFERFLEILSEASRHVPDGMKAETSGIAWRRISEIICDMPITGLMLKFSGRFIPGENWRVCEKP